MAMQRAPRTICCAYCGAVTTVPSARGPAPRYCSPAHRQAKYRQRRRDEGLEAAEALPHPSLREEFEALRLALAEAAAAKSWAEARRLISSRLPRTESAEPRRER
jgi:hypothetical protein